MRSKALFIFWLAFIGSVHSKEFDFDRLVEKHDHAFIVTIKRNQFELDRAIYGKKHGKFLPLSLPDKHHFEGKYLVFVDYKKDLSFLDCYSIRLEGVFIPEYKRGKNGRMVLSRKIAIDKLIKNLKKKRENYEAVPGK